MPSNKRPTPAAQQKLVSRWNAAHAVGIGVTVRLDNGAISRTTTTSEAVMLGGHTAVIGLAGISGCYALDRVSVANG